MITSTTTNVPRKGKLFNIKTFNKYLKNNNNEIKDMYGKTAIRFDDTDEYNLIAESRHFNIKTYFIVISCKNKILLIETDKQLEKGGKVISANFTELTDFNVEQFRKYSETNGKSGIYLA